MMEFAKFVALQLLRAYKWAISPLFPPACRYVPTCSEYAMEAVERYGAWRGGWLAIGRVLRCHPFARAGYDPVMRSELGGTKNQFTEDQSLENQSPHDQFLDKCGACAPRN